MQAPSNSNASVARKSAGRKNVASGILPEFRHLSGNYSRHSLDASRFPEISRSLQINLHVVGAGFLCVFGSHLSVFKNFFNSSKNSLEVYRNLFNLPTNLFKGWTNSLNRSMNSSRGWRNSFSLPKNLFKGRTNSFSPPPNSFRGWTNLFNGWRNLFNHSINSFSS